MDAYERIDRAIDEASEQLRAISLDIHSHPELNFEEYHAHDALTTYLDGEGFEVVRGAYTMPTAFKAVAGNGGPTVAVLSEYDALPGIGHACGHNLIAIAGIGAGIGLRAGLEGRSGALVILGSPAEEGGAGKQILIEQGAFDGVDAALMAHPSPMDNATPKVQALQQLRVEYFGKNAHAAAMPWMGVNALDALVQGYNAISMLRQQMKPTDRVHGVFTHAGLKPNIIPDYTAAEYYVRSATMAELSELKPKVQACLESAATATGCRVEVHWEGKPYTDLISSNPLAERYSIHMADLGHPVPSLPWVGASTDMGNVSYVVPTIHPMFGIPCDPMNANHTAPFTEAAATGEAHERTIRVAKAMARAAYDMIDSPELLAKVRADFTGQVPNPGDPLRT
ncbi:MAG: M20 family metallopeptidase [Dehalococcoidia bacterium]